MPELEVINSLLASGEIKSYERQFKPVILGNWRPVRPKEGLQTIIQKLCENRYSTTHPFYLALPSGMIPEYLEQGGQSGIVVGSNSMEAVEEGSFTKSISMRLLSKAGARFVVLDTQATTLISSDPFTAVNEKLLHLLNSNCNAFVVLGETSVQYMNNQMLEVLTTQLETVLDELPENRLNKLALIYAPSWVTIQGMTGLEENINKSYHIFRYTLENILGQDNASKVRVMVAAPHIFGSCYSYLKNSHYDGFYFPNAAVQSKSLLETWKDFNEKAPDALETEIIISESVEIPEEPTIDPEEPPVEEGGPTVESREPPIETEEPTLESGENVPLNEETPVVTEDLEPETEEL